MRLKKILSYTFSATVVICMLYIIAVLVHWRFFSSSSQETLSSLSARMTRQIQNWRQLPLSGHRSGPPDAPVQIVEFYDYECPFCKAVRPAIKAIRRKYPNKVSIVHENFPLDSHSSAFGAAIAAECARRQGKFIAYHDELFDHQNKLGKSSFYDSLAMQTRVEDQEAFQQCIVAKKTANIVKAGKHLGQKLGVIGIPTFLINGTLISGALPEPQLQALVDEALAEANE